MLSHPRIGSLDQPLRAIGFFALIAATLLCIACTEQQTNSPPPGELPETGAGSGEVGDTAATFGLWGDGMAVVVWSDLPALRTNSGTTQDGAAEYNGWHAAEDGRRFRWHCETPDGKTGSVEIVDTSGTDEQTQTFALADGSLLIVSAAGDKIQVTQLERDTSQLREEMLPKTLEDWRANDPEIQTALTPPAGQ